MAEHRHSDRPRRKRQYSMIPFVALGIAVVLIVLIIIGITSCAKGCSEDSTQTVQEQTATTNTNAVKDSESSFKMSIAGDYIIYSSIYKGANENANGNGYDFKPMVKNLRQFTEKCDVNYYNQETILGGSDFAYTGYPTFNSPQELGDAEVKAGFNIILHATNHRTTRYL